MTLAGAPVYVRCKGQHEPRQEYNDQQHEGDEPEDRQQVPQEFAVAHCGCFHLENSGNRDRLLAWIPFSQSPQISWCFRSQWQTSQLHGGIRFGILSTIRCSDLSRGIGYSSNPTLSFCTVGLQFHLVVAISANRDEALRLSICLLTWNNRTTQTPSENFVNVHRGHGATFPPHFTVRRFAKGLSHESPSTTAPGI